MTLTLFKKKNFLGDSHRVTKSHANLRVTPVGYRTRSLTMTSEHDRVLLFSKKMYRGRMAFARGIRDVPSSAGTFFRPVRSVRIDPFRLYLNVTVVCSGGEWPGSWATEREALASIDTAIDWANRVWSEGMVWLERRKTEVRDRPRTFELRWPFTGVPREWKRPGMVDVVIVHRIGRRSTVARRCPALVRDTIAIARVVKRGEVEDERMGHGLARELGRYVGLGGGSWGDDPRNLMSPGDPISFDPANIRLVPEQIERVQRVLAANRGRRAERHN